MRELTASRPDALLEVVALLVADVPIVGHAGLNGGARLSANGTSVSRVGVAGLELTAGALAHDAGIILARLPIVRREGVVSEQWRVTGLGANNPNVSRTSLPWLGFRHGDLGVT